MKRFATAGLAAALSLCLAAPLVAQTGAPDLDGQARCAALFAIVAADQRRMEPGADRFPPLAERGRDFFVATGLRLLTERQMLQAQLEPYFVAQIAGLRAELAATPDSRAWEDAAMARCLPLLEQLPAPEKAP